MPLLDLLAIAPHPDDAELTCGGTLLKAVDAGRRVGILDLTRGEMGTRGTPELRATEAEAAARFMRLTVRENLGLPDARLTNDDESRVRLVRAIRRLRPRVVIAPAPRGRHPDHRRAAELIRDACFLAGLARYAPGDHEAFRPLKVVHAIAFREDHVKPTFVVDVSAQFDRKLAAVACYASQFAGAVQAGELYPTGEPLAALLTHQGAHYGSLIRARFGEPFFTDETLAVDDLSTLAVSTF